MSSLPPPWSGLSTLAPRYDLSPVLRALPDGPDTERFTFANLRAAGLSAPQAMRVVTEGPWRSTRACVSFLRASEERWPASLVGVPFGPVALSLEGNVALLREPAVAIVGSRACTPYGRDWAARLASGVVAAGAVVVSGLAAGIDLAAHGASAGATIAVLGQGIDVRMPAWQQRARDALLARGGLVVSELPPETHATSFTFPVRNRIIAALGRVVAVVEAGERSGARNTATHAFRLGRDVLAVPGALGSSASVGCLDLIEQGARIVRGVHSVVDAAGLGGRGTVLPGGPEGADPLVAHLERPRTPEELAAEVGEPYVRIMEALGTLELTGRVIRLPGRRYQVRTR